MGDDFDLEFYADVGDQTVVFEPYYQQWGPNFQFTVFRNSTENIETLYLKVAANEELEASLVLRTESDMFSYLEVLQESQPVQVSSDEAQYFLYLPPSDQFFLSINYWIESETQTPSAANPGPKIFPGQLSDEQITVYIRSISPKEASELFRGSESIEDAVSMYDIVRKFSRSKTFYMREFRLKGETELLLMKVTGKPKHQAFFELSGSQIAALPVNKPLRGAVKNDRFKYKVYQVLFNKASVPASDLVVQVQACRGRVEMYVSEDFTTLWNEQNSYTQLAAVKGTEQYGALSFRV